MIGDDVFIFPCLSCDGKFFMQMFGFYSVEFINPSFTAFGFLA